MHAPATPGTSDSGSAAGSDSEQGSGPSIGPDIVNTFEVSELRLVMDSATGSLTPGNTNSVNYRNNSEYIAIGVTGTNLDQIRTAILVYSDGYNTTNINLTRKEGSTDTKATFSSTDFPENNVFYVDAVILNGEYVHDKREAVKKIYISGYTNSNLMGWVSGGGLADFGSEHTLEAHAADGYRFVRWEDGYTQARRTFIVDRQYEFRAIFEEIKIDPDDENNVVFE